MTEPETQLVKTLRLENTHLRKREKMTDGQLVKVMARMQRLTDEAVDLLNDAIVNHPNGEALRKELCEEGLGYRWALALMTHSHLIHPERWLCENDKLIYGREQ